jgi:DNA (cytosine-5)-methyltransferase 1
VREVDQGPACRGPDQNAPEQDAAVARYTVVDLFAGCGGLSAGFRAEGFEPVLAVESDRYAASTYAVNFPSARVIQRDIESVTDDELPQADVAVGGPPCQGFSGLGKRDPGDSRNVLWKEYLRVVRVVWPKVFVIENVDRFAKSAAFTEMIELLSGELPEYEFVAGILDAADYGVPQRRRRTFVIASRIGVPVLPEPTHARVAGPGRKRWRTVRYALRGLSLDPYHDQLPVGLNEALPGVAVPGPFTEAQIHLSRSYGELMLRRFDHVAPGQGRLDLPEDLMCPCWRNKPAGTTDVMGRLRWDQPSVTIRTEFHKPEKGRYLHPQFDDVARVNRTISHAEAARLQTFPRGFRWCGPRLEIARQIGNAVPPRLAAAIAHTVSSILDAEVR